MGIGDRVFAAHPDPRCHYCGVKLTRAPPGAATAFMPNTTATRDHTRPKCEGGRDWVPCCLLCNSIKGSDSYELFMTFMVWGRDVKQHERKNQYKFFRSQIIAIGLAAFEEERERLEAAATLPSGGSAPIIHSQEDHA